MCTTLTDRKLTWYSRAASFSMDSSASCISLWCVSSMPTFFSEAACPERVCAKHYDIVICHFLCQYGVQAHCGVVKH